MNDLLPLLFLKKDGSPMVFSMPICPEKKKMASIIETRGGRLVSVIGGANTIRILYKQNPYNQGICFNASYIEDCHRMNKLLYINDYRLDGRPHKDVTVFNKILLGEMSWTDYYALCRSEQQGPSGGSSNNESTSSDFFEEDTDLPLVKYKQLYVKGRREYTSRERNKIMRYIIDNNVLSETNGRAMWLEMEKKRIIPGRTWQSMKEHFLKKIVPLYLHECTLSEYEKRVVISRFPMAKKILNVNGSKVNTVPVKPLHPVYEKSNLEDRNQKKRILGTSNSIPSSSDQPVSNQSINSFITAASNLDTGSNKSDNESTEVSKAITNIRNTCRQTIGGEDTSSTVNQNVAPLEEYPMEIDNSENSQHIAERDLSFDSDMIDEMESETLEFDKDYVQEICSKSIKSSLLSLKDKNGEKCAAADNLPTNQIRNEHSSSLTALMTNVEKPKDVQIAPMNQVKRKENSLLLSTPVSRRPRVSISSEMLLSEVNVSDTNALNTFPEEESTQGSTLSDMLDSDEDIETLEFDKDLVMEICKRSPRVLLQSCSQLFKRSENSSGTSQVMRQDCYYENDKSMESDDEEIENSDPIDNELNHSEDTENTSFVVPKIHLGEAKSNKSLHCLTSNSESASNSNSALKNIKSKRLVIKLHRIKLPISSDNNAESVLEENCSKSSSSKPSQPEYSILPQPESSILPQPEFSQLPQPESSQLPQPEPSQLHQPEPSQLPQPEPSQLPQPESSQLPQPECSQLPQPECSQLPQPESSQLPQPESSQLPQPESSQLPQPESSQLPQPESSQLPQPESSILPESNQDHFSREDDLRILMELDRHIEHENLWGFTVWVVVASRFPGRASDSLRNRFINHIFPSIEKYVENSVAHIIRRLLGNRITMNNTQNDRNASITSTSSSAKVQADSNGRPVKYSVEEDKAIIAFLLENCREKEVGGKAVWADLVRKNISVLRGRTWHGLKERYKKRILPNLNIYSMSDADRRRLQRP